MRREVIVASVSLLIATLIRGFNNPLFAGPDSYSFLLAYNVSTISIIILACGILFLSAYIVYKQKLPPESLLIVAVTPPFLGLIISPDTGLFISFLTLLFIVVRNVVWLWAPIIVLLSLIPDGWIISILFILAKGFQKKYYDLLIGSLMLMAAFIIKVPQSISLSIPKIPFFILVLGLIGLGAGWNKQNYPVRLFLLIIAFAALLSPAYYYISTLAISILAGMAIDYLARRDWMLGSIRNVTLFLIFCMLLFIGVSAIKDYANTPPLADNIGFIEHVKTIVKSEPVYVYYTHEPVFRYFGINATSQNTDKILLANTAKEALPYLPSFIIINDQDPLDELEFIITHTKGFRMIYNSSGYRLFSS